MGIYQRNNIDYGNMLANMISNAERGGKIRADEAKAQGDIWSKFTEDTGSLIGKGLDYYQAYKEGNALDEALAAKEAERDTLIREASNQEQEYYNPTTFDYQARNNTTALPNRSYREPNTDWYVPLLNETNEYEIEDILADEEAKKNNPYALPGDPNATQSDYFNYIMAMNNMFGGR